MLNEILTEETMLNICLDNITKIDGGNDSDAFKYVTGYILLRNPELNDEEVIESVQQLIADKIIDNLIEKNYAEVNWESNTISINEKGREFFGDLVDA